ncbi:50S ribosomal protein L22 [Candidatus Micrarchaeota archaeon CG10_big_fil_rev_8_21_14_0_10_45_29]|nr:MAG: 50S ribosomal protein L22 [Candidatus Micrarchaeota archaeon CG10_big_fil_rev_8_21_14_0_10_45_29]
MANYAYNEKEKGIALARVNSVDASYRDLCNVCSNIRGRRADAALMFLTTALEEKRPIRYPRHNKRRGHVRSLGGKKGGCPVKSIKIVLNVLQNAVANANAKGLGDCKIIHIAANKQDVFARMSAKGRRMRQDFENAFVEIVLRELKSEENLQKQKEIKKKREEAKKALEAKAKELEAKKAADAKAAQERKDAKPAGGDAKKETNADAKKEDEKKAADAAKKEDEKKAADAAKKEDEKKAADAAKKEEKKEANASQAPRQKMSDVLKQAKERPPVKKSGKNLN